VAGSRVRATPARYRWRCTVDHTTRLRIHEWFVADMGEDLAGALMDATPPMQWDLAVCTGALVLAGLGLR
jgi:hypothetical protein